MSCFSKHYRNCNIASSMAIATAGQRRDGISAVSRGVWPLNAAETVTRRDLYRPFGQDFQIAGRFELAS